MKRLIYTALLGALLALPASAFRYTGSLANVNGASFAGGTIRLNCSIFNGEGKLLYSESHDAVEVNSLGQYEVQIGEGVSADGEFGDIDWSDAALTTRLEIALPGGETVTDERALSAVPYALGASCASSLIGYAGDTKYTLTVDDDGNLSTTASSSQLIEIPEGYTTLLFHDEFDTDGMPDSRYWGYEEGYVRGGEMQYYTVGRPENAYVKDGLLHIVTLNDNWEDAEGTTHKVTSASLMTKDKVKFKYGRIDIRAKLPICLGSWPALWLMPNDDVYGYWPNSGEIDIMEHVGFNPYTVYFTAHCAEQNGDNNKYHNSASIPTCTTDFHIYSLEWNENRLDWLVDGKRKWTVVNNSSTWRGWPYNQDFYLIMNTAFGGSWGGQKGVDLEALPITFEIDYVRIFQ